MAMEKCSRCGDELYDEEEVLTTVCERCRYEMTSKSKKALKQLSNRW
jgi:DNA-directed RNA polymerase subunit RPC12/RpoP